MSLFRSHAWRGLYQPIAQAETNNEPLRYGPVKRFLDRRSATKDGLNGLPVFARQPAATPTIRRLIAEFAEQATAERRRWEEQTAPVERELAKVRADIEAIQNAVAPITGAGQESLASIDDEQVAVWRHQRNLAELDAKRAQRKQLEQDITARHKQYLDRRNQLAAHTWRRIETYWDRLIQVHLDGERLNEVANNWGPLQMGGPLQRLLDLADQVINNDPSHPAIPPAENE